MLGAVALEKQLAALDHDHRMGLIEVPKSFSQVRLQPIPVHLAGQVACREV